jgi:hypothetical protein
MQIAAARYRVVNQKREIADAARDIALDVAIIIAWWRAIWRHGLATSQVTPARTQHRIARCQRHAPTLHQSVARSLIVAVRCHELDVTSRPFNATSLCSATRLRRCVTLERDVAAPSRHRVVDRRDIALLDAQTASLGGEIRDVDAEVAALDTDTGTRRRVTTALSQAVAVRHAKIASRIDDNMLIESETASLQRDVALVDGDVASLERETRSRTSNKASVFSNEGPRFPCDSPLFSNGASRSSNDPTRSTRDSAAVPLKARERRDHFIESGCSVLQTGEKTRRRKQQTTPSLARCGAVQSFVDTQRRDVGRDQHSCFASSLNLNNMADRRRRGRVFRERVRACGALDAEVQCDVNAIDCRHRRHARGGEGSMSGPSAVRVVEHR